jgi:hypothetical protein
MSEIDELNGLFRADMIVGIVRGKKRIAKATLPLFVPKGEASKRHTKKV